MDPFNKIVQRVTNFDFSAQLPKWSPDGQWILFQGQGDLHAIRPDGSDKRIVSQHRQNEPKWLGGWSPDGKQIVYLQWGFIGMPGPYRCRHTGYGSVERGDGGGGARPPMLVIQSVSFGADGRSILFVGSNDGRASSFRVRLDTHELIQLTGAPFYDYSLKEWARRLSVAPKQEIVPTDMGAHQSEAISTMRLNQWD